MTWNLLHVARMLKDVGGIPATETSAPNGEAGCRFELTAPTMVE